MNFKCQFDPESELFEVATDDIMVAEGICDNLNGTVRPTPRVVADYFGGGTCGFVVLLNPMDISDIVFRFSSIQDAQPRYAVAIFNIHSDEVFYEKRFMNIMLNSGLYEEARKFAQTFNAAKIEGCGASVIECSKPALTLFSNATGCSNIREPKIASLSDFYHLDNNY